MQQLLTEMEASRVESFPITFLDNIVEEDEDGSELEYHIDETKSVIINDNDNKSESSLSSPSVFARQDTTHSRFKVSVTQPEILEVTKDEGFVNPAFELDTEIPKAKQMPSSGVPLLRLKSIDKKKKKKSDKPKEVDFLSAAPSRRREKRDESLHTALMERYLLQSVVNKYLIE